MGFEWLLAVGLVVGVLWRLIGRNEKRDEGWRAERRRPDRWV